MLLNKLLSAIFINTLTIYIISKYLSFLWFTISFKVCSLEIFLFIGFIFWILDKIVKKVIKILTLPINFLTLGLFSIVINVWFIYLFQYVINTYFSNIAIVNLSWWIQVFIVSIVIWFMNLILKKL